MSVVSKRVKRAWRKTPKEFSLEDFARRLMNSEDKGNRKAVLFVEEWFRNKQVHKCAK